MSKIAEEMALKAYPPTYTTVKRHAKRVQSELVDTHKPVRAIFQQGYEKAITDIRRKIEELYQSVKESDGPAAYVEDVIDIIDDFIF